MRSSAVATALRSVTALRETSTMRGRPSRSRCVSVFFLAMSEIQEFNRRHRSPLEWRPMARLVEHRFGDIKLIGYSLAGEETVVAAPELNVCFDVGRAPQEILSIDHVFLTHGHMDHAAGLAYYFSQRNFVGNAAGTVLCPKSLVGPIKDLMRVWAGIEGHLSPHKLVGMSAGDTFEIRRGLLAKAFDVNHRVAALGFSIIDVRHKLKAEYANLSGPQLVELKKQGTAIEHKVEVPLIDRKSTRLNSSHVSE